MFKWDQLTCSPFKMFSDFGSCVQFYQTLWCVTKLILTKSLLNHLSLDISRFYCWNDTGMLQHETLGFLTLAVLLVPHVSLISFSDWHLGNSLPRCPSAPHATPWKPAASRTFRVASPRFQRDWGGAVGFQNVSESVAKAWESCLEDIELYQR